MVTEDTGTVSTGGKEFSFGEGLIPCRFLLSTHAGFYILSICSKYAKSAYAVL